MKGSAIVTGRRGEFMVIGKLLEKGFTVYTPVADVEGIDCIIRNEKGRLIQIQIKTRTKNQEEGKYFIVKEFRPSYDFFICCYLIDTDELWVIPSHIFHDLAYYDKKVKDWTLPMSVKNQKELFNYKDDYGLKLLKKGNGK